MKKPRVKLMKGTTPDVINANVSALKEAGHSHNHAMHLSMKHANKKAMPKMKKIAAKVAKPDGMMVKIKGY